MEQTVYKIQHSQQVDIIEWKSKFHRKSVGKEPNKRRILLREIQRNNKKKEASYEK